MGVTLLLNQTKAEVVVLVVRKIPEAISYPTVVVDDVPAAAANHVSGARFWTFRVSLR